MEIWSGVAKLLIENNHSIDESHIKLAEEVNNNTQNYMNVDIMETGTQLRLIDDIPWKFVFSGIRYFCLKGLISILAFYFLLICNFWKFLSQYR